MVADGDDVDAGRQTVDVGVYRPSFTGGVDAIRALGERLESPRPSRRTSRKTLT